MADKHIIQFIESNPDLKKRLNRAKNDTAVQDVVKMAERRIARQAVRAVQEKTQRVLNELGPEYGKVRSFVGTYLKLSESDRKKSLEVIEQVESVK